MTGDRPTIAGAHGFVRSLRVRLWWGDYPLADRISSPPQAVTLGERDALLLVPRAALGAEHLELVRVEGKRVLLRGHAPGTEVAEYRELATGEHHVRSFGRFFLEISAEASVVAPVRRFYAQPRRLAYFAASLLVHTGALALLAHTQLPLGLESREVDKEQLYLMQQYLMHAEERRSSGDDTERKPGQPTSNSDPSAANRNELDAARAFGMIGLLNADNARLRGVDTDYQSWGRDSSRGDFDSLPASEPDESSGSETYADFGINPGVDPAKDRYSTFAIDVDTASYSIARRKLLEGTLPPLEAIRAEECINSLDYAYPGPEDLPADRDQTADAAFGVRLDAAPSPFEPGRHFVRVALQGRRIAPSERRPLRLVYLVDTSGSMQSEDKLGLVQESLRLLTGALNEDDTVALSTYAGSVREVLPPTSPREVRRIHAAIDALSAAGGTAMSSGIELAYELAARTLVPGHESRVIVLSDGDANIGPTSPDEILELIARYREKGVTLSTFGFGAGAGAYNDVMMERLANAGDGDYSYVGSRADAQRTFGSGLRATIARDVKLQLTFDPDAVAEYRLIGYENRDVPDQDFRNDRVDGGELRSGHSVTALYDVLLKSTVKSPVTLSLRYKLEAGTRVFEREFRLPPSAIAESFESSDPAFRLAVAAAGFAEVLRGSRHALAWTLDRVEQIAAGAAESRADRLELIALVQTARELRSSDP